MQASRPWCHSPSVSKEKGGGGDRKVVGYINRSRWNWVRGDVRDEGGGWWGGGVKWVDIRGESGNSVFVKKTNHVNQHIESINVHRVLSINSMYSRSYSTVNNGISYVGS